MKKAKLLLILMLTLLVCKGQSLLQEGKLWSNTSIGTEGGTTYRSYFIKFMEDTTINELVYKKILRSDDLLQTNWFVYGYIREDIPMRKVFTFDNYKKKDVLLYDFSLEEGDSILTHDGGRYLKVIKVVNAPFGNSNELRKQIYFFSSNAGPQWIEGIGSTLGVLEGLNSFFTTGSDRNLVCYSENGQLIYHNPNFSSCFPKGSKVSIQDASQKWNIGTHCVNEGPMDPYDKWTTSFLHIEGDTLMNENHYKKLVSCNDLFCEVKRLKSYIREESGQVFLANKIEEIALYNFNLQQGDTMIMDFLLKINRRYFIQVDSVKTMVFEDNKERIAQYVTVSDYQYREYSIPDVFVEGIGSLTFGLEYPINLFVTGGQGCYPAMLCFYSGENLIYSNPEHKSCYLNTGLLQFQQPEMVQVYSNGHGMLEIQLAEVKAGRIIVFDLIGKRILDQAVSRSGNQFCLPSFGIYLYRFESDKGKVQTGKVLVK